MITSVELGNFLSHKKSEINFDNGVTVFIGENGSGKSSVIDGITYSLFGETTRGNKENLLRDGENQAYTKTNFTINGQNFTAIKKIQKKGSGEHKLIGHSGEPIAIRSEEVKDEIQRLIELDYDTLRIASIVPQGQLTDITDPRKTTELRDLIDKVMGAEHFSKTAKKIDEGITAFRLHLREQYKYTDADISRLEDEIKDAKQTRINSGNGLEEFETKQKDAEFARDETLKKIEKLNERENKKKLLSEKQNSIWQAARNEIARLGKEKGEKSTIVEKCGPCFEIIKEKPNIDELLTKEESQKKELEKEISEITETLGGYKNKKDIVKEIGFTDGECPICHSKDIKIDPDYQTDHINAELKTLESKKLKLDAQIAKLETSISKLEDDKNDINVAKITLENFSINSEAQLTECKNDIQSCRKQTDRLEEFTDSHNMAGLVECIPNIKESLSEIETLQEEISGYRPEMYAQLVDVEKEQSNTLEEINQKIGEYRSSLKISEEHIVKHEPILKEMKLAKTYIAKLSTIKDEIFSTNSVTFSGLRNFTIQSISDNASQYLEKLRTSVRHIKLNSDGKSIKIQCETITGSRPIKNLSGGEQVCVALAIRLGMADLMVKSPLKVMILDEPTASLDRTHCEKFVDIIQDLTEHMNQNQNFQLIIITHDEEIWDAAQISTLYKFENDKKETVITRISHQ
jgi:exonuclease SbcC